MGRRWLRPEKPLFALAILGSQRRAPRKFACLKSASSSTGTPGTDGQFGKDFGQLSHGLVRFIMLRFEGRRPATNSNSRCRSRAAGSKVPVPPFSERGSPWVLKASPRNEP